MEKESLPFPLLSMPALLLRLLKLLTMLEEMGPLESTPSLPFGEPRRLAGAEVAVDAVELAEL